MNVIRARGDRSERGGAIVLVLVIIVLAVVGVRVVSEAAIAGRIEARAQAGADAVALAVVVGSRSEAFAVARLNGVEIIDIQSSGDAATVKVRSGRIEASARASANVRWNGAKR